MREQCANAAERLAEREYRKLDPAYAEAERKWEKGQREKLKRFDVVLGSIRDDIVGLPGLGDLHPMISKPVLHLDDPGARPSLERWLPWLRNPQNAEKIRHSLERVKARVEREEQARQEELIRLATESQTGRTVQPTQEQTGKEDGAEGGRPPAGTNEAAPSPTVLRAGQSYLEGEKAKEWSKPPRDADVYEYLQEYGCESYSTIPMPEFRTWARYVGEWRRITGRHKNQPRRGRRGRSIITADEASGAQRSDN